MQSSSTTDQKVRLGMGGGRGEARKNQSLGGSRRLRTPGAPPPPLQRPVGSLGWRVIVPGAVRLIVAPICPECLFLF